MFPADQFATQREQARRAGYSEDEINSYISQRFTPPKPSDPKKKKNLLAALLPSATGTGGAVAGAALGTALLPGIGTLIGAGLGGAIGSGAGKVAENAINDDKLSSGVAGEAALGGLFGAGPLRLGKAAIDTAKVAKSGVGLADALKTAGDQAVNSSIRGTLGQKLTNASNDLVVKDFRLTPTQLNNFKSKFGEDASQVIKRHKLTGGNADSIAEKAIKPLQDEFDSIASKIPAIPKANLQKAFESKYGKLLNSGVEDSRAVGQQLKSQANTILQKYGDTISPAELNNLRREFDSLVSYADKAANPARYGVNKRAADTLRTVLQDAADSVGLKASNGLTFKETGRELQKLRQLADNVGKQEQLGRGSLPASLPNLLGGMVGAGAAGGPMGALGGIAATQTLNSNIGRRAITKGTEKLGSGLTEKALAHKPYSVGRVASRVVPTSLVSGLLNGSGQDLLLPNIDNSMATPTTTNATTNAIMPQQYTDNSDMSSIPALDPANLQANVLQIIANGGTVKNVQDYVGLVTALQEVSAAQQKTAKPPTGEQQKFMNNALSGLQDIQFLRNSITNDPQSALKANIPGGGLARALTGTSEYDAAKNNIMDVLARLRTGAAITKDEQALFTRYLPSSFDSPEIANSKLDRLEELFMRFAQPNQANSPSTLEEALLASS